MEKCVLYHDVEFGLTNDSMASDITTEEGVWHREVDCEELATLRTLDQSDRNTHTHTCHSQLAETENGDKLLSTVEHPNKGHFRSSRHFDFDTGVALYSKVWCPCILVNVSIFKGDLAWVTMFLILKGPHRRLLYP